MLQKPKLGPLKCQPFTHRLVKKTKKKSHIKHDSIHRLLIPITTKQIGLYNHYSDISFIWFSAETRVIFPWRSVFGGGFPPRAANRENLDPSWLKYFMHIWPTDWPTGQCTQNGQNDRQPLGQQTKIQTIQIQTRWPTKVGHANN